MIDALCRTENNTSFVKISLLKITNLSLLIINKNAQEIFLCLENRKGQWECFPLLQLLKQDYKASPHLNLLDGLMIGSMVNRDHVVQLQK